MAKHGRPCFKFTDEMLQDIADLASEAAPVKEICRAIGCAESTFYKNEKAMEAFHAGQNDMRISLRHWQFLQAKAGNTTMLIWLGRNLLGQREQPALAVPETQEDDALTKSLERIGEELDGRVD